jgi:hypothetical protein
MNHSLAGCPMGVECTSGHEIDHQFHGGTTGTPPRHQEDHWLALAANQIPVGVRLMLKDARGWSTHWAEHKWWGYDGSTWYTYLTQGAPDTTMGRPLGDTPGTIGSCCPSNALWGIAGAITLLAIAHGANAAVHSKKRKM